MSAKQKPSGWVHQPLVLFPEVAGSLWAVSATAFGGKAALVLAGSALGCCWGCLCFLAVQIKKG